MSQQLEEDMTFPFPTNASSNKNAYGLFTWREEDPSTRKILEGQTTFRLVYMQKFRSGRFLEIK